MPQKKRGSTVPHKQAAPAPKKPCTEAAAAITGDTAAAGPAAVATEIDRHVETIAQMWSSIAGRRERERDTSEMNIVEQVILVSKGPLKLPLKDRVGFEGQNSTNGIGPVPIASAGSAPLCITQTQPHTRVSQPQRKSQIKWLSLLRGVCLNLSLNRESSPFRIANR